MARSTGESASPLGDEPVNQQPKPRVERTVSIDLLRGIVMVVMALDHARDFFDHTTFAPEDLDKTTGVLFFTRWITHFCAPSFVFLAGTAAWLSRVNGKKSDGEIASFLWKRGLWLVFLELTVVYFCWLFSPTYARGIILQVIWAIGWSMVFLSLLVRLSTRTIAFVGGAIVLLHNTLDSFHPGAGTLWQPLWELVHEPRFGLALGPIHYNILYPLVPWVGVMALGYVFGSLYVGEDGTARSREERSRLLLRIGLSVTAFFVVLRASNLYGDPNPWSARATFGGTVMSFLNCQKYPPSLCYLTMTLGPAITLLGLFDRGASPRLGERGASPRLGLLAKPFVVFGRVPLFYYVLHLALLNAASEVVYTEKTGTLMMSRQWYSDAEGLTVGLPLTYLTWIAAVVALYPLCLWFSRVKASPWGRERAWLSYL